MMRKFPVHLPQFFSAFCLAASTVLVVATEPPPVADPLLWLDAADAASLVRDEGGRVSEWKDRGGKGNDVRQETESRRPTTNPTALGGRPAVVFSGAEWLAAPPTSKATTPADQFSLFVVFQTAEEHPLRLMGLLGSGGIKEKAPGFILGFNDTHIVRGNNAVAFLLHDGVKSPVVAMKAEDTRRVGLGRTLAPQYPLLLVATFRSGETPSVRVQGKKLDAKFPKVPVSAGMNLLSGLTVGAADRMGEHPFAGAIAEVVIYDRALSEEECGKVEQWLTERHALKSPSPFVFDPRAQAADVKERPQAVTADGVFLRMNGDELLERKGEEWTKRFDVVRDPNFADIPLSGGLLATTPKGTMVIVLRDRRPQGFVKLSYADGAFSKNAKSDVYAFRSEDGGKTWQDGVKLQDDYCGALRDIKVTGDGTIVVSSQAWDPKTERHVTLIHSSKDDGKTYRSTRIDNGIGWGMHDGFYESTITELGDGRILLLGRTGLGVFWQCHSADGGLTWTKPEPTEIESGSYPGYLLRLKSGRIVLAWNRYYPDGFSGREEMINVAGTGWFWGLQPVSRFNRELSIAFSDDDGKSWSKPEVIAEGRHDFDALAYPFLLERKPGEIFLWAGPVAAKFNEADFVAK